MHVVRRLFRSYFHRFFLLLFLGVLIAIFVVGSRMDLISTRVANETYRSADVRGNSDAPSLEIGLFVSNLYDVDHSQGTFSADGQIWGRWDDKSEDRWMEINSGKEVDEGVGISFDSAFIYSSNALSEGSQSFVKKSIGPLAYPKQKYYYQTGDFSSDFKMHQLDYRKFPFESIYLPIELRTMFPVQRLVLSADEHDSLASDRVSLPGYRFVGLKIKNVLYQAKTFFGHDVPDDWNADGFTNSQLQWELHFRRAIGPSFVRLFLPLASAMAAVIFSLVVSFKVSVQKIGIPASILLVLAVLQDRWHNLLPSGLKYFTYMDKMFVFAYLMTMVVLVHSVYCVNRCFGASEGINSDIAIEMRHHQRILASCVSVALLVAPFVLWIS